MKEKHIQQEIRRALGIVEGLVLWRNNCGYWHDGKRGIRYGLAEGSSDLVGICDGRFFALEVKRPGEKPTEDQRKWMNVVRMHGGFATVVTSAEEALLAVERCRDGEVG